MVYLTVLVPFWEGISSSATHRHHYEVLPLYSKRTFSGSLEILHGILAPTDLQICVERMVGVQQLTALNTLECLADMNEGGMDRVSTHRDGGEEQLLCPKPRRVAFGVCPASELLKPARRLRSHASLPAEGEAGCEIMDILFSKGGVGDSLNTGSLLPLFNGSPPNRSLPFYCGSPPSRAGNPLIHDVQFTQKRIAPPPVILPKKASCSPFGANPSRKKSSCSSSHVVDPSVRVEGFASSGSDAHKGVLTSA